MTYVRIDYADGWIRSQRYDWSIDTLWMNWWWLAIKAIQKPCRPGDKMFKTSSQATNGGKLKINLPCVVFLNPSWPGNPATVRPQTPFVQQHNVCHFYVNWKANLPLNFRKSWISTIQTFNDNSKYFAYF